MNKYHIWYWPFLTRDDVEFDELVRDLEHLYPDDRRTFRVVDADIRTHGGWRSRIASETRARDTVVTIYVMGHLNIGFDRLYEHLELDRGRSIGPEGLARGLSDITGCIDRGAKVKIKFMNCRSAHAPLPVQTCRQLATLFTRLFEGFAYALDVVTKSRRDDGGGYHPRKFGMLSGGPSSDKVQLLPAKEARFQVWPVQQVQQPDGTMLQNFLDAIQESERV